jgi:pimeloyl-ACP methyl ester carboxylesterase
MLARLQKITTLSLFALSLAWVCLCVSLGATRWAMPGALALMFGYAGVLALEFLLLSRAHGNDPAPRATPAQLAAAWWGEVCSAPAVFCWRQPFRSNKWPDRTKSPRPGQRGLVLVHGFVCNRGLWNPWLARLLPQAIPCIAVNLEPVFGSIDLSLPIIEEAVKRLEQSTGLPPVLVAHSMGGLAVRRWLASDPSNDRRFHRLITIASPHQGTWLARFSFSPNGHQVRPGCEWLLQLADAEPLERRQRFTCFYGHCDNIVFPPSTATLNGADNRHLEAVAHVHMVSRPEPFDETLRWVTTA